jgi:hypothetical protein
VQNDFSVRNIRKQTRMKVKVRTMCNFEQVTSNSTVNLMKILQGSLTS